MRLVEAKNKIPYIDFGGKGPLLHFAHANGYPPRIYQKLLVPFTEHFRVVAMHQRPLWKGAKPNDTKSWKSMADDMIRFLDENQWDRVIGMGHSMGAVNSLYAVDKRPDLFHCMVFIEPVFFLNKGLFWTNLLPSSIRRKIIPPAIISSKRRDIWPGKAEAFEFFRSKKVFNSIDDEVLKDFVEYGLKKTNSGEETLVYSKEWETQIYTLALTPWKALKRLRTPSMGIRGARTNVINEAAWQHWQDLQPNATFFNHPDAGHLIPQEYPEDLAKRIMSFLNTTTD